MTLAPVPGNNTNNHDELGEEYEVEIVYQQEHTGSGFCWDLTCPCHEDSDNMQKVGDLVQEGHLTTKEADHIYRGKNI